MSRVNSLPCLFMWKIYPSSQHMNLEQVCVNPLEKMYMCILTSNSPVFLIESSCSLDNRLSLPLLFRAIVLPSSKLGSTNRSLRLRVFFFIEEVVPRKHFHDLRCTMQTIKDGFFTMLWLNFALNRLG